jgi:hypothetical protein
VSHVTVSREVGGGARQKVSHVTVSVGLEGGGRAEMSHVTVSGVWRDAATHFFSAPMHSVKDLGTRTRSLLQGMCSLVGWPDMVLQHMQRVVSQHMQRMVL